MENSFQDDAIISNGKNKRCLLLLQCVFINSSVRIMHLMRISKDVMESQILCQPFQPDIGDMSLKMHQTHPPLHLVHDDIAKAI
jgi:hypothetical protein